MFGSGEGKSVQQTSDGGYIVVANNLLIKTDSEGGVQWNRPLIGSGNSVEQTSDGGYIIAGNKNDDLWIIKKDSNGDYIWEKTFGWSDKDGANSVQQTPDDGYIVAGYSNDYVENNIHVANVYVIKTNSSGDEEWHKTFNYGFYENSYSVDQTSDGGYVVVGEQNNKMWMVKLDSEGNEKWNKILADWYSRGNSIKQTLDGGYIITGYYSDYYDPNDYPSIYLIKTDSSGNKIWDKTFSNFDNNYDVGYSVQQTTDGGYIVAGSIAGYGDSDFYIVKTDSNGNKIWDKNLGIGGLDRAESVQQTTDKGYIVAGKNNDNIYLIKLSSENPIEHCQNGIKDFDEEDIDCGGSCQSCISCSNRIKDGNEEGVDCGGPCPFVCGYCKPLIKNGDHEDKIDIVFIPDKSYNNNTNLFLEHIKNIINNSFNSTPYILGPEPTIIQDNLYKFNFYYIEEEGEIDWNKYKHKPPKEFYKECSFYDGAVMIHTNWKRDFARGNIFSSEYYTYGTIQHEFSHSIFNLADEYCCDSYYFQPKPFPNIWKSNQSCRNDMINEGWDTNDCKEFCPQGKGRCGLLHSWWRSDPLPDIMENDGDEDLPPFERADLRNIHWTFDQYPDATSLTITKLLSLTIEENNTKTIVLDLFFINSSVNLTNLKIIYNDAPDHYGQNGNINITTLDVNNNTLSSILFWDPRIIITENESVYLEEANTTISIKTSFIEKYIRIYNETSLLLEINLSKYIKDFCSYKDGKCDLDCVDYRDVDCPYKLSLTPGWNLISIPIKTTNMSVLNIFNTTNLSIFGYKNNSWFILEEIDNKLGYWIKVNESINLTLIGTEIENKTIELNEGWNLIGYPNLAGMNVNESNLKNYTIFSYNNSWSSYVPNRPFNTLDTFTPGFGYWLYSK